MLYDGVKKLLYNSLKRKQGRKLSKLRSRKRERAEKGTSKEHLCQRRPPAYSRFSIGYFVKVVISVCTSNHRMNLVRNSGFGFLLELDDCYVPRPFAQWIADNIRTEDEAIVLKGKHIPLNPETVSMVLGIPSGVVPINTLEEETGKLEFLALFGRSEVPPISFFGNNLMNEVLEDDEYIRCFLIVALATFLCPTSNTKPSTKYMGALVDVSRLKELDWCSFVHKWNMFYVKKYQTEKGKQKRVSTTLGGCIYQLAVRCLDINDFGLISIPSALPRICFWKGQTIKHFSDMLIGADGKYDALKIKDEAETCYAEEHNGWASTAKNSNVRKAIDRAAGSCLSEKVKEEIYISFQANTKDENLNTCSKSKQVLLDTLLIISASSNCSDSTVKLQCDDECKPTIKGSSSERTVRVDSEGNEVSNDESHVNKRSKTNSQQSTSSKAHTSALPDDMKEGQSEPHTTIIDDTTKQLQQNTEMDAYLQNQAGCLGITPAQTSTNQEIEVKETSQKKETLVSNQNSTRNQQSEIQDADRSCNQLVKNNDNTEKSPAEKSSSLNYLVLASNLANILDGKEHDVDSKEEDKEQSPPEFAGFEGNFIPKQQPNKPIVVYQRKEKEGQTSKSFLHSHGKGNIKRKELDIDMNKPAANSMFLHIVSYQPAHQALIIRTIDPKWSDPSPDPAQAGATCTGLPFTGINNTIQLSNEEGMHPLDIARKKYFFCDDSTPTCRLFEDYDDCGNRIKEPELFRPVGMNAEDYNAKIEEAKKSMPTILSKQNNEGHSNQNDESMQGDFSIHCAQRDPLSRETCKYTHFFKEAQQGDGIIDLVFSTNTITGKRLFQDETVEQQEQDGTKQQPITIPDDQLSPEVKILGERVFIDSCYHLTKDINFLYITNLTLGSASSSRSKENIPPKRIVYPSKFQCSPYANYDRGPLMLHERKAYANIILLSKLRASQEDYFLEKWRNEGAKKSMRSRALASFDGAGKALPLHECDRLLFPTVYESHWFLFVVDFVTRKFIFLDSLYGASSEYHTEIKDKMIQNFINTWEESRLRRMGFKNFGIAYPNLPKQVGSNACGIFVLKRMQTWDSRNPTHSNFKMKDVEDARVRFAVDILFSLHNTIQEVKKLIKDY